MSETAVLDGNRVTREGTALVVKRTGILANPARGDVVYLKEVEVRDDVVVLGILSREIVPIIERRSTAQMRYKGELEFHFAKGHLKSASLEGLKRTFDDFLEPL